MNENFASYPMGPTLRSWLGIAEEAPVKVDLADNPVLRLEFTQYIAGEQKQRAIEYPNQFVDLLDELLVMDLPYAVLELASSAEQKGSWFRDDFRGVNTEGIAAMMLGETERAKACFSEANTLLPEEPAPYANMAKILQDQEAWPTAWTWILAGLNNAKNHIPLWELAYLNLEQTSQHAPLELKTLATELRSWVGMLLLADADPESNSRTKYENLVPFYEMGERSADFLVEYTAALGMAQMFEQIPHIVWEAERAITENFPWRLHVHKLQAVLSMDKHAEFVSMSEELMAKDLLPLEVKATLGKLVDEIRTEIKEGAPA